MGEVVTSPVVDDAKCLHWDIYSTQYSEVVGRLGRRVLGSQKMFHTGSEDWQSLAVRRGNQGGGWSTLGWGMAAGPWRQKRDDTLPELYMVKIKRENRSNQVNF